MYHRAFTKEFFKRHQSKLLWLLNGSFRDLFRKIMCIDEVRNIYEFQPNNYKIITGFTEDNAKVEATFFTHDKFAKRLYHAFKPLWWAMHAWDWAFADRIAPSLSFGFDTLTAYPDANPESSTVDGYVGRQVSTETWSTLRDNANGTTPNDDSGSYGIIATVESSTTSDQWAKIFRGIFLFDTSSITDGNTIDSATLSLYSDYTQDDFGSGEVDICSSNPASNTALANGDYDSFGTTSFVTKALSTISDGSYNEFSLNASGLAAISDTGITKLGCRIGWDIDNSPPTWANNDTTTSQYTGADYTGTTRDPKLVVVYSLPVTFIPKIAIL
jgi:hypothetical protein